MPIIRNVFICGITLLLSGCVAAPVPLAQTEIQHPWSGRDAQGHDLKIEAHQKNWYFPILVSVEGSGKEPITTKCDYRYFLVRDGQRDHTELTFLRLDEVDYTGWLIKDLPGTDYLMAERISSWGTTTNTSPPPELVQVDLVVFEGSQLKHRRTISSMHWSGSGGGNPVWDRFKDEGNGRYIIYRSTEGMRRYDVWENIDEPCQSR